MTKRPGALLLVLALSLPAAARAQDCAFAGAPDPDGAALRREKARTTGRVRLLASHPSALGASVDVGGITGVKARLPRASFIDDEVLGALAAAKVSPAPLSSDAEFLRRVTLDLTGRIPDVAALTAFLADGRADKRARAVDALLASDAFVDRWALFYDDLFRDTALPDSGRLFVQGRNAFHGWFVQSLRGRKPYDAMAREMIAASGVNTTVPAGNFKVRNIQTNGPAQDTYDNLASDVGRAFLGLQIFCTSCHSGAGHTDSINLYLSTVSRADFWGMAAFFSRQTLRRGGTTPADYDYTVGERPRGEYLLDTTTGNKSPRDGTIWANGQSSIAPKYLTGGGPAAAESYAAAMARSVTADPQFARAAVNYVWKEMFGAGIVEPADSFDLLRQDPENPPPDPWTVQPTHPRLLQRLADYYVSSGYDLRALLRLIATSSAYQLSSSYPGAWDDAWAPLLARHFARRLRAEEMLDAITAATGVPASLPVGGYAAPVAWAGQLPDVLEPGGRQGGAYRAFLDTFLRGDRDGQPRSSQGSISQALSSLNDRIVTERVKWTTTGSLTQRLVVARTSPEETVRSLYLATLSRPPSPQELEDGAAAIRNLKPGQTAASATEDLQYALLNKLDFLFCY